MREFVELVFADIVARACDAGVMAADRYQAELVAVGAHGAEFEKAEILVTPPDAGLPVEDGAFGVGLDPDRQDCEKRAEGN